MKWPDGSKFIGFWADDVMDDTLKKEDDDRESVIINKGQRYKYTGSFKNGFKTGHGMMEIYKIGQKPIIYTGGFNINSFHDYGTLTDTNSTYHGQFKFGE